MKILYVWDGKRDLPQARKACVHSTACLYPDAEIFCITKASEFLGYRVISWDRLKAQMAAFLGVPKDTYAWNDPMTFADWARFYFLAMNPGTLYLDTDCRMKQRYDFQRPTQAGVFLLYVPPLFNGLPLLAKLKERAQKRVNLLNDFKDALGWEEIPDHWYQHK
jgi:hypothetical protein